MNIDIENPGTDDLEIVVRAEAKRAITKTVWDGIRPVALALSGLYLLFAIGHLFLLPESIKILMVGFAGTTAIILFGLSILVQRLSFSPRLTYPICFFIIVIASVNSLLHLFITQDIFQTTNLILVIFGAGYFILSRRWYFVSLLLIILGWVIFIVIIPDKDGIIHFSIALFSVSLISTLFSLVRTRTLLKVEKLRLVNEHQRYQLEKNILVIEEREQRMNAILNTAVDGIIVIDEQGIIQTFNKAASKMFGYTEREAIGQNVNILMPASNSKKHNKYLSGYTNKQASKVIGELSQREGKRKNGEIFPLSLTVSTVELKGRTLFTGIIRDVSEQVRIENELKETRERLQTDIDLAAQIQANLMAKTIPEFKNFEFNAVNIPARYLSGDFYDIMELNSNIHQLVLGDFAGKGIPAALLALSTRSLIRAESDVEKYPGVILALLNQTLFPDLDQAEVFATLFIAQVDLDISRIHYASAGHGEALLWRNAEKNIVKLQATGLPIGVFLDETYNEQQIEMRPGDVLIIYSDGITDSTNTSLEYFGFDRLAEIIEAFSELSASALSSKIINRVKQFSEGHDQDDDISLLVMRSIPRTIELEIPGTIAILDHIMATIHEYAIIYSMDFADEVELACSEAITNIIKHAYRSQSGTIQIKIHLEPDGLILDLFDQGESFDIELISKPDPDNLLESGYGISIMNQIFDEIVYESDKDNGNHWRLVKKFIGV